MRYKLFNEPGIYRDIETLEPKNLLEVNIAWTPEGENVGWDEFANIEEAMAAYNIELIPEETEEEITNQL